MIKTCLFLVITASFIQSTFAQVATFDFETAEVSGPNFVQEKSGVILTVSSPNTIFCNGDYNGWGGISGLSVYNINATSSITFSFNETVTISSLIMADNTGSTEYYTLTPTPNTGTQDVTVTVGTGTNVILGTAFEEITAITITKNGAGNFYYLVDNLVLQSVLPVELSSFTASIMDMNVNLNWRTATEVNNYGFEVERTRVNLHEEESSQNSQASNTLNLQWQKIGFVKGSGNSNSPVSYSYIDNEVPGTELKYRLKQLDIDGNFKYSPEVSVSPAAPGNYSLQQNYPNPFNPVTIIKYAIPDPEYVTIKVFDILGKEVQTLIDQFTEAGMHKIEFNANNLPGGLYFYRINAGNYTEVRKMLLVR